LTVLDAFNRSTANTLNNGANWSQTVVAGVSSIQVNDLTPNSTATGTAFCNNTGALSLPCSLGSAAYWNSPAAGFGAKQGAQFTFANTTLNNTALALKASGGGATAPQNFIRVLYTTAAGGSLTVGTTINLGVTVNTAGTLTGFGGFVNGETIEVQVDAGGAVLIWKTTATNITSFVGSVQLPNNALWTTGGGRVGIQLPPGGRIDNFAAATLP
jgi:hypothetical protein